MRRLIISIVFMLAGGGFLFGLGIWQVQRLGQKEAELAAVNARIGAAPVDVPAAPDPAKDAYLAVTAKGRLLDQEVDVLTSRVDEGPGYHIISVLQMADGRRVMVDRGFLPAQYRNMPRPAMDTTVVGNLQWPREVDSFTPAPDLKAKIWFARDVPVLAKQLNTEPTLIVARHIDGEIAQMEPIPVDSSDIPNDHLGYAITWFSLAFCWLGMIGTLLWRDRRRTV